MDTDTTRTALPPVVAEYVAAFEAFDLDRIVATLAEDAIFEEVPTGTIREGRDAIRAHTEAFTTTLSDFSVRYTSAFATDTRAAGEWIVTGRYTGQLEGLPPGEGQELRVRGADVLELAGGRIQRIREYADFLGLLTQIGVLPGPEDAPSGATPAS